MQIVFTTSRKPSRRTRSLLNELIHCIPNSFKLNRGKKSLVELIHELISLTAEYFAVILEYKGNPRRIAFYKLHHELRGPKPLFSITIEGVKLYREIKGRVLEKHPPSELLIDAYGCETDECFKLADLLMEVLGAKMHSARSNIRLVLSNKDVGLIEASFINTSGEVVGPVIKVSKVRLLEGEGENRH
ncbi:MAG: hypothetical protein N3E36_02035 [Sulfolobales archaeon]|nr:hypothetical protein [Sulfolobales archaeon]MCX8198794.1 hypothetical protein [Sulfolobales archaeon]MDW8169867.1 hypothetical protein [Desulfurococcaceae archaeon]